MCVGNRNSHAIKEIMKFFVVCSKIYKSGTFLLDQILNLVIVVTLVLTANDKNCRCPHAFQCIPARIYICCLRVIYIEYATNSGNLLQTMLHTRKITKTFSYVLFFYSGYI